MSGDVGATAVLLGYYAVVLGVVPMAVKASTRVPDEVVRKFQHVGYAASIFIVLGLFERWYAAVIANALLVLIAYPLLAALERRDAYHQLLTDRTEEGGELRRQVLYVHLTFVVLIAGLWGALGPATKPVIAAAVMAWGLGDAAAALIGKFVGRREVEHPAVERAKTVEGTAAMAVAAVAAIALSLALYGGASWAVAIPVALIAGPLAGLIELVSRDGVDTITVPLGTAVAVLVLLVLVRFWTTGVAAGS